MSRLSLCMIVRDNERIIEECLGSIKPWVDEMIVVDTGSVDRTPDIARGQNQRWRGPFLLNVKIRSSR